MTIQYIEGDMKNGKGRIAIVVARFNQTITERLLVGAVETLTAAGIPEDDITVIRVPGAFETPMVAARLLDLPGDYAAVICLGAVIRGETSHDEHINRAISLQFADLGIETGVPVIFGVLTCNTVEQANARSAPVEPGGKVVKDKTISAHVSNKGCESAEAALEMIDLLEKLDGIA